MAVAKEWPNNAASARNQAAEGLQAIIRLVRPLLKSREPLVVARAGLILDQAQNALRHLEKVGAQTEPDDVGNLGGGVAVGGGDLLDKQ